jgi:hypothetical protein
VSIPVDPIDYIQVPASAIPPGLQWVTPQRYQGQISERSFARATALGPEPGYGDLWMRVIDHSEPPGNDTTYYKHIS